MEQNLELQAVLAQNKLLQNQYCELRNLFDEQKLLLKQFQTNSSSADLVKQTVNLKQQLEQTKWNAECEVERHALQTHELNKQLKAALNRTNQIEIELKAQKDRNESLKEQNKLLVKAKEEEIKELNDKIEKRNLLIKTLHSQIKK
ncbi:Hypothetical_protein [Hexamita inflata]|uniref:Hypothetical_protein n=1 Tax=Hexamita inflata TaxID=28002 RepID=A0AA86QE98_9EUKA|nr:Hypothetical protein HINF_LOCUS45276 [Hexamita inflata]